MSLPHAFAEAGGRLFAALSALVVALVLPGCGDDTADTAEEDDGPEAVAEEGAPAPAAEPEAAGEPDPAVEPAPAAEPGPAAEPPAAEARPPAQEPAAVAEAVDPMAPIIGVAIARESATIEIDGRTVLLYGLESMYPPQRCSIGGQVWECWAAAVRQLQTLIAEGPVTCAPVESPDVLGRVLAICEQDGEILNERYVRSGFALAIEAEMPEYAALEAAAREEGIGLWQGAFQEPADFRADRGIRVLRP